MIARDYFNTVLLLFVAAFLILPTSKMVNNFYYVFMAVPGLFFLLREFRVLRPSNFTELVFYALCSYIAIYSFFEYPRVIVQALYVFVFVLTVSRFVDVEFFNTRAFARVLFWGALLYAAMGAVSYYLINDVPFGVPVNPGLSRLDNPIHTSMFIACTLFVIGPHWIKSNSLWEGLAGFVLAFLAIALVFQSRSGLVGVGLWMIFMAISLAKQMSFRGVLIAGMAIAFLIIVSIPLFDMAGQSTQLIDRADSNRLAIWAGYLTLLWDCGLVLGCGFPELESSNLVRESSTNAIFHPHNIYVEMTFHYGIILLLLFVLMMAVALHMALRQKNWWGGYLLAGLLMLNFDGSRITNSPNEVWLMMWLPFALVLAREWQISASRRHHNGLK